MSKQDKVFNTNYCGIITTIDDDKSSSKSKLAERVNNFNHWLFNELIQGVIVSDIIDSDTDKPNTLGLLFKDDDNVPWEYYMNFYGKEEDEDGDTIAVLYDYWEKVINRLGYKQLKNNIYPDELYLTYTNASSAKLPVYSAKEKLDKEYNSQLGVQLANLKDVFDLKAYFTKWFNTIVYNYLMCNISKKSFNINIYKDDIPVCFTNNIGTLYRPFVQFINLYSEDWNIKILSNGDLLINSDTYKN